MALKLLSPPSSLSSPTSLIFLSTSNPKGRRIPICNSVQFLQLRSKSTILNPRMLVKACVKLEQTENASVVGGSNWGKVSSVLFDMDGVLCNSEKPSRMAAVDVFAEMGVHVIVEDFVPFTGTCESNFLGGVANLKGVKEFNTEAAKKEYAKPNSGIGFPGALELITQLHMLGDQGEIKNAIIFFPDKAALAEAVVEKLEPEFRVLDSKLDGMEVSDAKIADIELNRNKKEDQMLSVVAEIKELLLTQNQKLNSLEAQIHRVDQQHKDLAGTLMNSVRKFSSTSTNSQVWNTKTLQVPLKENLSTGNLSSHVADTIKFIIQELTKTGHAMWTLNQQFQARSSNSSDSSQPIHFDNSKMGEKSTETQSTVIAGKEKESEKESVEKEPKSVPDPNDEIIASPIQIQSQTEIATEQESINADQPDQN